MTFVRKRLSVLTPLVCLAMVHGTVFAQSESTTAQTGVPGVSWDEMIDQLSRALPGGDSGAVARLLDESAPVVSFSDARSGGLSTLVSEVDGRILVSSRAYDGACVSLATDLASDLRDNPALPTDVRKALIPETEAQRSRANVTASQWARNAAGASLTDPVALIVFYDARPTELSPRQRLTFVLIRGEKQASGACRITKLVFGDPLDAPKQ